MVPIKVCGIPGNLKRKITRRFGGSISALNTRYRFDRLQIPRLHSVFPLHSLMFKRVDSNGRTLWHQTEFYSSQDLFLIEFLARSSCRFEHSIDMERDYWRRDVCEVLHQTANFRGPWMMRTVRTCVLLISSCCCSWWFHLLFPVGGS